MTRVICLAALIVAIGVGNAFADESGDTEFVPGFPDPKVAWKDVARIELIEGVRSYQKLGRDATSTPVSDVILFRYRDDRRRPLARIPDPLHPRPADVPDLGERLKMRGEKWKELVEKHNPSIHLVAMHLDHTSVETLIGGIRTRETVKQQTDLNQPLAAAIEVARQDELDVVNDKLLEHQENKDRATFWYFAVNALLGCATIAVLAFLILPALRRPKPKVQRTPNAELPH